MTSNLATTGSVLRIRHNRHHVVIWRPKLFRVQAASGQVSLFYVHLVLPYCQRKRRINSITKHVLCKVIRSMQSLCWVAVTPIQMAS